MKKLNIKDFQEFKELDFEGIRKEAYRENSLNKNNLSFWFDKVKDCGFKVPETHIIPIDFELYKWLSSDSYTDESIDKFKDFIISNLKDNNFNTNRPLFLKTGTFSNKFDFQSCKLTDLNNIGKQFLDIYYTGMLFGAVKTNELVVREFISETVCPVEKKTIYGGLPLNTEFRVFYDFDKCEVMGIFNYWDRETMIKGLSSYPMEEIQNFIDTIPEIEKDFEEYKEFLKKEVTNKMKGVNLTGQWSIDFMKVNWDFYLIDMALAHESYYYNKLNQIS